MLGAAYGVLRLRFRPTRELSRKHPDRFLRHP